MLSMLVIFEVVAQLCPKDISVELYIFLDHQFLDAPPSQALCGKCYGVRHIHTPVNSEQFISLVENPSSHELWGQRGVSI